MSSPRDYRQAFQGVYICSKVVLEEPVLKSSPSIWYFFSKGSAHMSAYHGTNVILPPSVGILLFSYCGVFPVLIPLSTDTDYLVTKTLITKKKCMCRASL
jgi:hypothetical protein